MTPVVTLGAQYLHYGFGNDNRDVTNPATGDWRDNAAFIESIDMLEARISFKPVGPEAAEHHVTLN